MEELFSGNPDADFPTDALNFIPPTIAYKQKGVTYKLICDGVCTNCAHCGLKLTDSISVERGMGPLCSKKGYNDADVVVSDEVDAMIALAEYPVLVDYLVKKYKPSGNRALVNALVRTASLNRRSPVHGACADAVDMLGYKTLASKLRESLSSVEIKTYKDDPECYAVWVKNSDFVWGWWGGLRNLPGVRMSRDPKATIVPKRHRAELARLTVQYYSGLFVSTEKGSFRISEDWIKPASIAA